MDVTIIICVTAIVCCLIVCNAFGKKEVPDHTADIAKLVVDGILASTATAEEPHTDSKTIEQFDNMLGEVNDLFGGVNDEDDTESK